LHCREAMDDMIPYLIQSFKRLNSTFQGVFHCFSGDDDKLRKVLDMGFYVGFDGNISYPENELLRQMVKATPINRLLLETDAPYLTPEPYRGQPSEPAYIPLIAKEVASIKNTDLKNIEQQTTANALALFSLSP
ncbi:TatD family hydrolase, partial [Candidatus Gottesmanbacteria bacterium]|nr:TatD family hydrolase [Candidatus Gottesmanbacteria bacterium]